MSSIQKTINKNKIKTNHPSILTSFNIFSAIEKRRYTSYQLWGNICWKIGFLSKERGKGFRKDTEIKKEKKKITVFWYFFFAHNFSLFARDYGRNRGKSSEWFPQLKQITRELLDSGKRINFKRNNSQAIFHFAKHKLHEEPLHWKNRD